MIRPTTELTQLKGRIKSGQVHIWLFKGSEIKEEACPIILI